jgi:DNA-directed RNA polymerase subunit RPC12/RpoP
MSRQKKYPDLPERSHPDYMKLYAEKNREQLKEQQKTYRAKRIEDNPNHYKEQYKKYEETHKQWRKKNRHLVSEKQWKSRGIVDMSYEKFLCELDKQDYKCIVCNKELTNPQVDHDHNTGKYRGILCVPCNNGLGVYEKKKDLFENYLKRIAK